MTAFVTVDPNGLNIAAEVPDHPLTAVLIWWRWTDAEARPSSRAAATFALAVSSGSGSPTEETSLGESDSISLTRFWDSPSAGARLHPARPAVRDVGRRRVPDAG